MSWPAFVLFFALVENLVLVQFLGICPLLDRSRSWRGGWETGLLMSALLMAAVLVTWTVDNTVLALVDLPFLRLPLFVLVLLQLFQLVRLALRRWIPRVEARLAPCRPWISVNCLILGLALVVSRRDYTLPQGLLAALAAGMGFVLVLLVLTAVRERLEIERIPRSLRGVPIALISAGLLAMAFMAFDKILLYNLVGG